MPVKRCCTAGAKDPPLLYTPACSHQAALRRQIVLGRREILPQIKVWSRRNPLWISRRQTAELGQKIRRSGNKLPMKRRPIKRERGECFIHPAVAPVSLKSAYPFFHPRTLIRRTEPCGPSRGGGPGPYGHWKSPFSDGNHGPWNGDGGWVGRYASFGIHLLSKINMLDSHYDRSNTK